MSASEIEIIGAKTHNLHNISVAIPKHRLIAIVGVSGSGKSSLISTLAAGAQQAVSSLFPPFIQSRMKTIEPGSVDELHGVTFTAVVRQKRFSKNARSSVGTAAGISPYLRLVFSRSAEPSAGFSPSYSPNDPRGMCQRCNGLGYVDDIDLAQLISPDKSLDEGAIQFPSFAPGTYRWKRLVLSGISDTNIPWKKLSHEEQKLLLYGQDVKLHNPLPGYPKHGVFTGVIPRIRNSYLEKSGAKTTEKERIALQRIVKRIICPECCGQKLNRSARESLLNGLNIAEASTLSINELAEYMASIDDKTTEGPRRHILLRCTYMNEIGLGYLTLDRATDSLSGGEAQRLRIVGLLGAPITDATFIIDEPSSGLHPADVSHLLQSLKDLRNAGNTVIVVEHNTQIIAASDYVVELGPGAGGNGGEVIFAGSPQHLKCSKTPTGEALNAKVVLRDESILSGHMIEVSHAREHNLCDVSVGFPLQKLTVVSGVAGSGKSSLVSALARQHKEVTIVDQTPLPASSRSSLLTVLDLADSIRSIFAQASGLEASWFSPHGKGACPLCHGRGVTRVDMAFMDDVKMKCEQCEGKKFNDTALSVRLPFAQGSMTIAEVLNARLDDVQSFFADRSDINATVALLRKIGLGYLTLGQSLNTLSGGELQRVKLVRFLRHCQPSDNVIVLDEISNGLHVEDVKQLIDFLRDLTRQGMTIIAVEHNPIFIAGADYNIDLGPGAGKEGGRILFSGTAKGLAMCTESVTGQWLHYRDAHE